MRIAQSQRDSYVVLALTGRLDLAAAPQLQRVLLKHLDQQPPGIICDLAGVEGIDPLCAGVFSSVRHPALGWPGTVVGVCGARPAVAAILADHLGLWSLHDRLDEAVAHLPAPPLRLRERLALGPGPTAAGAARGFVRRLCARWDLDGLAVPAVLVANELVTNAVVHARTPLELRVELEVPASRLQLAVHDRDPQLVRLLAAGHGGDHGLGLTIVGRLAKVWGVRQDPSGGKVVWCILDRSAALPEPSPAEQELPVARLALAALPGSDGGPNGWHRQLPAPTQRHPTPTGTR
jgi:anti-anti-sigma regulatory factor/anti-sigma regulatory factor (Ser/Thr protein kinase)